ncbi:PREDICTED: WAT1-related protein At4g01450-like [Camelina sativa]|uniref:WAT1-related protein n=1 Tax=Camelina sativa TaxID=90675 RepID=A0ABM0VHC7_CAMSA|nr:PREDICTED: WAT1-related protein At4g01450-like [Camelina sativa]
MAGFIDGKWAPMITGVFINIILGMVNALVKKVLDGGINHMVIATYRLGISTVFLIPIAYFWERKTRPKLTISISCQLFVSALFGASLMQYFYLLGLSYTSATLGSAFWAIMPSLTFVMALIFGFEKLNLRTKVGHGVVLGTLISLVGALLLTMYEGIPLTHSQPQATVSNNHTGHENWIKGCLFLLTGVVLFSSWMLIQAKINTNYPSPYSSTVILSVFGTLQCALLSLIKTRHVDEWILKDELTIVTVVIAGVVAQGMCTVGISWCIKQQGPVFSSAFSPVVLMSATLFDFLILHRVIYLGSVIGSVVVVIGLYIFLWSRGKQIEDCKTMKLPTNTVDEEKEEEGRTNVNRGQLLVIPMTP